MWRCKRCKELLDETQHECFNCGLGRDGIQNEVFEKLLDKREAEPIDFTILESFVCPQCASTQAEIRHFDTKLKLLGREVVMIVCLNCGYSEECIDDNIDPFRLLTGFMGYGI